MNQNAKPAEPDETGQDAEDDPVLLQWVTHPARVRPAVTIILILFLTLMVAIVYSLTESIIFTIVGALILWGSLSQYFLPTRFTFYDSKVRVKYTVNAIEKEWRLFRSYYRDKNGVLLSPFVGPSRLENFRGLYVRFAGNKDEVMAVVADKIKKPEDI